MTSHSQPVGAPELKSCPICRRENNSIDFDGLGSNYVERKWGIKWFLTCCFQTPDFNSVEEAVNYWNNIPRPVIAPMPKDIAEAIARLKRIRAMHDVSGLHERISNDAETIDAALESATQRLALMESQVPQWQPIETAPKDGTEILGIDEFKTHMVTYWVNAEVGWAIYDPIFWMPLLVPPSKDK